MWVPLKKKIQALKFNYNGAEIITSAALMLFINIYGRTVSIFLLIIYF